MMLLTKQWWWVLAGQSHNASFLPDPVLSISQLSRENRIFPALPSTCLRGLRGRKRFLPRSFGSRQNWDHFLPEDGRKLPQQASQPRHGLCPQSVLPLAERLLARAQPALTSSAAGNTATSDRGS